MTDVDKVLEEAAAAVKASGKKVRTPKGDSGVKATKEPKEKLYVQWNEDGSPMLDADGNRVKLPTKMDRPKKPRAEGSGTRNSIPDGAVLHRTEKEAKFREGTNRHSNYVAVTDGITAGEYFEKTGGRGVTGTFLQWYIKEGYVVIGE